MCLAGAAVSHAETKYAVCVGINTYSLSGAGDLTGCVNDAAYFYTNLVERGGWSTANMTKLLNSGAKKSAIRKAISNCAAKAVSGDTFVYQHSSHGGQNSGRSVFLCAYDDYYEDTEVAADLRSFAAGVKVVVVVDACHSGGLFQGDSGKAKRAASEFDLAGRVTELMEADRARRAARGEAVEKSLSAKEIGWVTAANYTESSLDGGFYESDEWLTNPTYGDDDYNESTGTYPSSYKLGGVFLGSFTWSWWNGACDTNSLGDGDGYADAYECWKDAYDFCTKIDKFWDVSGYSFTPQCTNTAVLRSVELGWAGKEEPSGFRFAKLPDLDATVGSPVSCTLSATNTDGSAVSVSYAVSSATAPAAAYSIAGNVFTFTPAADGSFSFSFTATDALTGNTAKGTLTVDAALAAPTGLANSGVTATSFTANWGAVAGAASYLLDVASAPFAAKGASRADGDVLLSEDFAAFSGTAADRSSTLDTYLAGTGWTGSKVFENGGSAKLGSGSFNGWIATPALDLSSGGAVAFDLTQYGNGDGNTVSVSILSGGDETEIGTATPGETATVEFAIPAASEATSVKISTSAKRAIIDNLVVTGGSSADILPAQEVTGTSFAVEGLATDTYYWRVRAVGNAKGPFSETMDVTLVADPTAPPSIRPIANIEIEVGEIATAEVRVTTPEEAPLTAGPEITAGDAAATLEGGVFSFAPAAPGTYEFTITAANANDSASISFAVTATLAEPETPEVPAVVGSEGFTAEWTAIPGAESYELVVIEGKGGSSGGGGYGETLTETFAKATFSSTGSSYSSQTITGGDLGTWTATECRGDADAPIVRGTGTLTSPEIVGGVSAVEFDYSWPFSDSGTCPFDLVVNGSKVSSASVTAEKGSSGTVAFGAFSAVSGASTVQFVNNGAASKMRMCFDEIRITTASAKSIARAVGDVVYSNNVGNVTRFEVTGLQPSTEYTFSFRAIAGDETTDWSEPVSVTTSEGPSAPVWTAIPAQNTYAGATFQLDLSAYLSGSPTPTVTADVGTVTGLHYVYEPEATGSVTVTLTASNDSGTQQTSFVLSVAEPPVGGNHYAVVVGCNKYDTEYVPSDNFLNGCVPDANHVHELITSRGEWEAANVTKLTDSSAKHSAVLSAIAAAAAKAVPGDTFLYFHSSHGGNYTYTFVTNTALYTDWPIMVYSVDPEGVDNCICTYDADFTAAELASALAAFDPAVNIVVMIDACHSAGMFQYTGTPVSQRIVRRNAAGKAMRSADASVFAEAVSAQIGAIRRARGIRAASNVAFVTAANFDEYSYDSQSGDGGEFTSAFIEGVTNGACDGADYGDQDGWATFYEGWNYAKDIAVGMAEGTEVDYEGHTVDANGYALYDNAYYAEEYDEPAYYYDYYFTHAQIDNEPLLRVVRVGYAGNPTLAAPVANPAADVTASSFTASWSAVADATSYRLQVATDESFSTGASSDALTAADLAATGSNYTEFSGVAKGSGAVYAGKTAKSSGGAIQLNAKTSTGAGIWTTASGGTATRIAVEWSSETGASRSLQIYGSTTALDSYAAVKAATLAGTIAYGSATAVDLEGSYPYVGILAVGGAVYLDSVSVDWGTAGSESSIVLDQDVGNVTSYEVTGLEAETDYFYRVQALGDPVDSDFSNVISLTTESGTPYAPVWSEIPEQSAVVGQEFTFDAADYVKASPAATIELAETTAAEADYLFENGYLIFTPSAEGSFTFSLNAKNDLGEAPATLTVAVAGAPVTVPELTLSNPTATTFDADWTACTGATSYQFQVATDDQFTPASAGGAFTLVTSVDGLVAGEYVILADGTDCAMNGTCSGASSGYLSCEDVAVSGSTVDTEEASIIWTLAGDASSCTLFNAAAGKYVNPATTKSIGWADTASGSWTLSVSEGIVTVANSANPSWKLQYNSGSPRFTTYDSNQKKLRFFRRDSRAVSKDGGSLVLDETMSELGCTVQNLEPETTYYARVRMADGKWSAVESISTEADVPTAPSWSEIPAQTVVAGENLVVDLTAYASGSPKPTITADAGTVEAGVLTVSFAEPGDYAIALTAENSEGTAPATLTVTVTAAPVTVPVLALSNPQAKSFDASWTECTGVSSYTLQVATDDQFTTGSAAGTTVVFSNAATKADTPPEGWTYDVSNPTGSYLQLADSENSVVSEAVSTKGYSKLTLDFRMRTYNGATANQALVEFSSDGTAWTELGSASAENNKMNPVAVDASTAAGLDSVRFRWTCPVATGSVGVGIDHIALSGEGSGGDGSLVKELTVEGTTKTVDGLEPETLYYARVKGAAEWSAVESIKTQADVPAAPEWLDIPDQTAIVGKEFGLDLSIYVTGSPFPAITVDGAVAEGGNWSFTPEVEGEFTFELVATNTEGSDSTTLTVVVSPAPAAKYALCVGVNDYDYSAWEEQGWEITPLHGTVNDATYFKKNLTERGGWAESDITFLANETATKDAIRAAIGNYASKAKAGDTFVYQHSSHGLNHGEDAYVKDVGLATYATIYEDFELAEDLAAFADGVKVVIVIDACHSGGMFKGLAKAGSFDIAARVSALMDANRTARKARGEDVSRNLTSDQVGWVTAADFDETSKDAGAYDTGDWVDAGLGGVGMGTVPGGVFLASFTWGGWTGKADVSGTGDGDGWLDAYEGWAFATPVCAEFDHTPQFLNEDVLRSVELGWIGEAAPSAAIVFDPVPGAAVGIGEEATLNVVAKNADGTTDGITLSIVEPSPEELAYTFADGTLTFTPDEDGLFLFTVQAVHGRTSATKLLGVTAVLPAPVALDATGTDDDSFTANWTGVDAAECYQLQVSTDPAFPMAVPDEVIEEGFDDVTSVDTLPEGWEFDGKFGTYPTIGGEAPPSIKLANDGDTLLTPAFELTRTGTIEFWTKGNGSGTNMTSTLTVEQLVGEAWTALEGCPFVPSTAGETKELKGLDKAATRIRFVMAKTAGNIAIDDVAIGQANEISVVDDAEIPAGTTSYAVEDLDPGTTYYYRVRALANTRSAWSEVIEVTTTGEKPIPVPVLTVVNPRVDPDTSIGAYWDCKDAAEFHLQVATDAEFGDLVFDEDVTENVCLVTNLTPDTTYYVRVCALDGERVGEWSEAQSVTTAAGGGEPEEPEIGGEDMEDFQLISAPDPETGTRSIKTKATGKLAEDYNSVKLEYATELVDREWNFDKTVENGATWPEIDFEYPNVDFAIMRFVFEFVAE